MRNATIFAMILPKRVALAETRVIFHIEYFEIKRFLLQSSVCESIRLLRKGIFKRIFAKFSPNVADNQSFN